MNDTQKFQTLKLNQKYQVNAYTESFRTEFGESRILLISEDGSDEAFEVYATKLLLRYVNEMQKKNERFSFTVKEKKEVKYPYIEGYSIERKWIELK
jgi:hypothetical protein